MSRILQNEDVLISDWQANAENYLGSKIAIPGSSELLNNNTNQYSVSGTGTLTRNLIIGPDPSATFVAGCVFKIVWDCTVTRAGYSIIIFNTDMSTVLSGAVTTTINLSYNGTDWVISNGILDAKSVLAAYVAPVLSVAGKTGAVVLVKGDVGLGNVDNTSDANKPVSTAQGVAISNAQAAATAVGSAAQSTANSAQSTATSALSKVNALMALDTVATWAAGVQSVVPTANLYYLEVTAVNGNVTLNVTPLANTLPGSEITIFLGFTGTYTVTQGSNAVFPMITGVASVVQVLTLVWNGATYYQKSLS